MRSSSIDVDLFCGGGGVSEAIRQATGKSPDVAVNHDPCAIRMHQANHPETLHLREDVLAISPIGIAGGRHVRLVWASPDCRHHSSAKGGKPRDNNSRFLAWTVIDWAEQVRPQVIILENVPEFRGWGPLDAHGKVIPSRAGETFSEFCETLRAMGYRVEWAVLNSADYGAPTSRKRLFLVARCDGWPIQWPAPTHGPGRLPYRTAAECIDWSIPIPSIFHRRRPLAPNTLRRIARGIRKFVVDPSTPFIISHYGQSIGRSINAPLPTITAGGGGHHGLVVPVFEASFIAKHYGGVVGHGLGRPLGTITQKDHHSLVTVFLERHGVVHPVPTAVTSFLTKFYGTSTGSSLDAPVPTVTATGQHLGIVTVHGEAARIVDVGMRMLQPRELANAQGFPPNFVLTGSKTSQIAKIGNSVPPAVAAAVIRAQFPNHRGFAA